MHNLESSILPEKMILNYHLMHPGGNSKPGDPNLAFCLDGYYHLTEPKAIHYTDGGPWFDDYQETMYSHLWKSEEMDMHNGK